MEEVFIYDDYYFDMYYQEMIQILDSKDNMIIVLTNTMEKDFTSKFDLVHVY